MPTAGARSKHRALVYRALDLYAEGKSLSSIAIALDITMAKAAKYVAEGIADLPEQDVSELRAAAELRTDRAVEVVAELIHHDDPNVRRNAARDLVNMEAARSRMLGTWLKPESHKESWD